MLLRAAAEAWDELQAAREAIARDGMTYTDRFGAPRALRIARLFHGATLVLLYAVFVVVNGGWLFGAAVVVAGGFLVRHHRLVSPTDLSRVDAAFFTANGWLSVAVLVLGAADVFLR